MNLNIRYGQMTMALLAEAALTACAVGWENHSPRGTRAIFPNRC
jgi:hypothetical protein